LHPSIGESKLGDKYINEGKDSIEFLKKELTKIRTYTPVVIFFHYPTQDGMSNWWSETEKDAFYNAIKNYNIILIAVGHSHSSAVYTFRDKFTVVKAAGSEFAEITYDPIKAREVNITFVNAQGQRTPGQQRLSYAKEKRETENPEIL